MQRQQRPASKAAGDAAGYRTSSGVSLLRRRQIYFRMCTSLSVLTTWLTLHRRLKYPHKRKSLRYCGGPSLVARKGFEPLQTESESVVLPLHNRAIFLDSFIIISEFL